MQKRRRCERERARVRERAEQERARDEGDRGSDGTGADATCRVDDVPATSERRSHGRGDAVEDRPREPGDQRRLPVVERLDEDAPGCRDDDRLAEVDEVVVGVAAAREPDAPVQHFELASGRAEGHDVARTKRPNIAAAG